MEGCTGILISLPGALFCACQTLHFGVFLSRIEGSIPKLATNLFATCPSFLFVIPRCCPIAVQFIGVPIGQLLRVSSSFLVSQFGLFIEGECNLGFLGGGGVHSGDTCDCERRSR